MYTLLSNNNILYEILKLVCMNDTDSQNKELFIYDTKEGSTSFYVLCYSKQIHFFVTFFWCEKKRFIFQTKEKCKMQIEFIYRFFERKAISIKYRNNGL